MDRFNICQAFSQLESDFNKGGWLQERPSNQRRRESIGCQLARMSFSNPHGWVDIEADPGSDNDYDEDEEVREIYMRHVLLWNLPIDAGLKAAIKRVFVEDYWSKFPEMHKV